MPSLSRLFEPLTVRGLQLKNRYVMPPMVTNYCESDGRVTDRLIDYHVARAKGGVAINTVEASFIRADGRGFSNEVGIHKDEMVPGLKSLVDEIHAAGGKASIQLFHGGRQAASAVSGYQPIAPSPICCPVTQELPRQLGISEIKQLVEDFGAAAYRARQAGFDAVEIHGAHGYLIAQFLSPFSNRRLDEYGGGTIGRSRFAIEVIQKVRQVVGPDLPIIFRISGDEYVEGGLSITETKIIAPLLVDAGVDILSVSAGNYATPGGIVVAPMDVEPGVLVPLTAEIKKSVSVPVIAVDRLHNPLLAEQVLNEGKADLIAIGRALLTDPDLPNKAKRGELEEIYSCISCNQACIDNLFLQKPITCLLNPACGREREFALQRAPHAKKVIVVGGGPAGMEAARIAALRGHDVTLLERGDHLAGDSTLGGDFAVASIPPKKEELTGAITWMIQHVHSAGAKIETGVKATPDYVAQLKPDVAIIATGADPMLPPIPGINRSEVLLAQDVLLGKANPGARVLVVGGGLVGVDVAEFNAVQGKKVTIIEMLDTIGADLGSYRRYWVLKTLADHGTVFMPNTKILEISEAGVKVEIAGQQQNLGQFDSIIVATGYRPSGQPFNTLRSTIPELHIIGDAAETRTAVEAIYEGSKIAREI